MIEVKICGLTREGDVRGAARAGARYAGFLLTDSPRRVTMQRAGELARIARAEGLAPVAVMVNPDDDELAGVARAGAFEFLQLHGTETPRRCMQAGRVTGSRVIKAIAGGEPDLALEYPQAWGFLFDAPPRAGERPGGHGRSFDWTALDLDEFDRPWFLAGGLKPGNVARAREACGAMRFDVSSGVEMSPGQKSYERMRSFVEAASRGD